MWNVPRANSTRLQLCSLWNMSHRNDSCAHLARVKGGVDDDAREREHDERRKGNDGAVRVDALYEACDELA